MTILTTPELAEKLAGGDSYIRTKGKIVKGLGKVRISPRCEIIVL
ncbi:hypothetical protein [Shewanella indica]